MDTFSPENAHPPVVDRDEWLAARRTLLADEKALTKEYDRVNAVRRRLPMVKMDKEYRFVSADGEQTLLDLFAGGTQLIIYHFMFESHWDKGCPSCTAHIDLIGDLSSLDSRGARMILVSRAPIEKLLAYREERGWSLPWYSAGNTDFNEDLGTTVGPEYGPVKFNFKSAEELERLFGRVEKPMEIQAYSVFLRVGDDAYHTYSAFARGCESLTNASHLLDVTPYGRQEDFEDSPAGWPQRPTYG